MWTSDPIVVGMAGWDWAEEDRGTSDSREYCVWRTLSVMYNWGGREKSRKEGREEGKSEGGRGGGKKTLI